MSKFQDDPMINESGIIVLLGQVWVYAKKENVLGEERERTNLGGRKSIETVIVKTDLICYYLFIIL